VEKIGEFIKNMNILKKGYFQHICPLYLYAAVGVKMQTLFKTEENKDRMDTPGCSLYLDRPFCYKP